MAKFRQVYTSFWEDPKVMEEMTPEDKYFYLYLLTNPKTRQIGVYQITKKQMAFDLGYSIESIHSLLERFIEHHKIIKYNEETRELCVLNWGKYNLNRGGKPMLDLLIKELKNVKDLTLLDDIYLHIENTKIKEVFEQFINDSSDDTLHDTYHDTVNNIQKSGKPNVINGSYDTYHDTSTIRGQEQEEEQEEEIEEEQQQELEELNPGSGGDLVDQGFKEIIKFYRENIQRGVTETPFNYELLQQFYVEWGNELMMAALMLTAKKEAGMPFLEAVFKNWRNAGVKNVEDARRFNEQLQKGRKVYGKSAKPDIVPDWYADQSEKTLERSKGKKEKVDPEEMQKILQSFQAKKSKSS